MRKIIFPLLLAMVVLFGCITQTKYPAGPAEALSGKQSIDLDNDGIADLLIYDFEPVTGNGAVLTRQVAVAVHTVSSYDSFNALSSQGLVLTRSKLDQFDSRERLRLEACANSIGLRQDCTILSACTVLCQGSTKCKKALDSYGTVVPASMIGFVDDRNALDQSLLRARNNALGLNTASEDDKNAFLNDIRASVARIADIYSNPIYSRNELGLCSREDLGISGIVDAADDIGSYSTEISHYSYYVTVSATADKDKVSGIALDDTVPASMAASASDIASEQNIAVSLNGSAYVVSWASQRSSEKGHMLSYRFDSDSAPDALLGQMSSPAVALNMLDLGFLGGTEFLFVLFYEMSGNFFIALGAAFSATLVLLVVLYNVISVGASAIRAQVRGDGALGGVRAAFARTELSWKSDIVFGALLFAGGFYLSYFVVEEPSAPITLMGAFEYFTVLGVNVNAAIGLAAVGLVFLGILGAYRAAENLARITVLEQVYGVEMKKGEDLFYSKVRKLKERIKELSRMVEEYSGEDFEVGQEYDTLTSVSVQRIDELSKKMTGRGSQAIDDDLIRIEGAIERLSERKKMADENWEKWSDAIKRMLGEQNEVYVSSMVTIPASLRTWALRKYAKESGNESIVFERDSLKKKEVSPEYLLKGMIESKVIGGGVLVKNDQVIASAMADGSGTVASVLCLRLRSYLRSLAKSLGQHEPVSFAVVGEKNVFVLLKTGELESVLFIPKDKFKEAIEEFRKKSKSFA